MHIIFIIARSSLTISIYSQPLLRSSLVHTTHSSCVRWSLKTHSFGARKRARVDFELSISVSSWPAGGYSRSERGATGWLPHNIVGRLLFLLVARRSLAIFPHRRRKHTNNGT